MKRRGSIEIYGDILRHASEGKKRTHIMHGANLSFALLQRYLGFLEANEFVKCEGPDGRYHLTPAGSRLLQEIRDVENLLARAPSQ